jgi:hypothetical protein
VVCEAGLLVSRPVLFCCCLGFKSKQILYRYCTDIGYIIALTETGACELSNLTDLNAVATRVLGAGLCAACSLQECRVAAFNHTRLLCTSPRSHLEKTPTAMRICPFKLLTVVFLVSASRCQESCDGAVQRFRIAHPRPERDRANATSMLFFLHVPRTAGRTYHGCFLVQAHPPSR